MKKIPWTKLISKTFLALVLVMGAHSCGEESLGGTFVPDELPEPEESELIPIAVGDKLYFNFKVVYRSTTATTQEGELEGEIEKSGNICLNFTYRI